MERAIKQADLELLQWAAASGEIDICFLDEAGFCLWMPAEYSYFMGGQGALSIFLAQILFTDESD